MILEIYPASHRTLLMKGKDPSCNDLSVKNLISSHPSCIDD